MHRGPPRNFQHDAPTLLQLSCAHDAHAHARADVATAVVRTTRADFAAARAESTAVLPRIHLQTCGTGHELPAKLLDPNYPTKGSPPLNSIFTCIIGGQFCT